MISEAILSSKLAYEYLDHPDSWMDVRPLTHSRQLALFNPGEGEVQFYRQLGWDVRIFVFSQGLILMWHELGVQVNWLSLRDFQQGDWSLLSEMDTAIMNRGLGMTLAPQAFLQQVLSLLPDQTPFYIQIENCRYFQSIINVSSRETPPHKKHYVRSQEFSREEVQAILKEVDALSEQQWQDNFDAIYFDEGRQRFKTVTGPDCFLRLPFDQTRDDYFIQSFQIKLLGEQDILSAMPKIFSGSQLGNSIQESPVQPPQIQLMQEAPQVNLETVQKHIESGDLIRAQAVFKQIELASSQDSSEPLDAIKNMKGLLSFYKKNFEEAFISFIDAIELNPGHPDYYLNLKDVALELGKAQDVVRLYEVSRSRYPALEAISSEMMS